MLHSEHATPLLKNLPWLPSAQTCSLLLTPLPRVVPLQPQLLLCTLPKGTGFRADADGVKGTEEPQTGSNSPREKGPAWSGVSRTVGVACLQVRDGVFNPNTLLFVLHFSLLLTFQGLTVRGADTTITHPTEK